MTLTHGSLCTGYGGLDMAVESVFGSRLAWWSDVEPGPIAVMRHHVPNTLNLGDIKTTEWHDVEPVDILTAGYPCQPFSNAGKRLGTDDPRHLWPYIAYAIGVLRPPIVILENVAAHLRRGFDVVLAGLAALGYDTAWTLVRASDVGAPHRRERLFIVACDTNSKHRNRRTGRKTRRASATCGSICYRRRPAGNHKGHKPARGRAHSYRHPGRRTVRRADRTNGDRRAT